MPDDVIVRPGEGRAVRLFDPARRLTRENTPAEGVVLPWSLYVQTLVQNGDLVIVSPAGGKPPAASKVQVAP